MLGWQAIHVPSQLSILNYQFSIINSQLSILPGFTRYRDGCPFELRNEGLNPGFRPALMEMR